MDKQVLIIIEMSVLELEEYFRKQSIQELKKSRPEIEKKLKRRIKPSYCEICIPKTF